ncbi:MAG: ribosome maturation factor RimM [Pseudomonadota bacterium]
MSMLDKATDDKQYIMLGKLNAHLGVKGWLKVYSYTDPKENILSYSQVLLFKEKANAREKDKPIFWKQVEIIDGRLQGKGVVVHIKGYDNREAAAELIGTTIGVSRDSLAKLAKDDYYWIDLIGLSVINQEGITLGNIDSMLATAANDVMIVKPEEVINGLQKEYLIPYIMGKYVFDVNLEAGTMQVDWDIDF